MDLNFSWFLNAFFLSDKNLALVKNSWPRISTFNEKFIGFESSKNSNRLQYSLIKKSSQINPILLRNTSLLQRKMSKFIIDIRTCIPNHFKLSIYSTWLFAKKKYNNNYNKPTTTIINNYCINVKIISKKNWEKLR